MCLSPLCLNAFPLSSVLPLGYKVPVPCAASLAPQAEWITPPSDSIALHLNPTGSSVSVTGLSGHRAQGYDGEGLAVSKAADARRKNA